MKKLELKYKSFNELPIGKYFQIKEELSDITDDQERVFTLIAALCEVEVEDVYKSPMNELSALINEIKWFSEPVKPTKAKTSSPILWPKVSFTALKLSISIKPK